MARLEDQLREQWYSIKEKIEQLNVWTRLGIQALLITLGFVLLATKTIGHYRTERDRLLRSIEEKKNLVMTITERVNTIPVLEQQLTSLEVAKKEEEYKTPPVPPFLHHLGKQSHALNIKVVSVALGTDRMVSPEAMIQEVPIKLELLATYDSIQEYIQSLYTLNIPLAMENLTLEQNKILTTHSLKATVDLKLFFVSQNLRLPASIIQSQQKQAPPAAVPGAPAAPAAPATPPGPTTIEIQEVDETGKPVGEKK